MTNYEETKELETWRKLLKEREQKQLTVKAFCDKIGCTNHKYYTMVRRIKAADEATPKPSIVALDIDNIADAPKEPVLHDDTIKISAGDINIVLSSSVSMDTLTKVIGVLKHA